MHLSWDDIERISKAEQQKVVSVVEEQFYVVLDQLRDHPEGLIGVRSLRRLSTFLDGWCFAHKNRNVNKRLQDFDDWVHDHYKVIFDEWFTELIAYYHGEDEKGFNEFWRLYDLFNEQTIKT